MDPEQRRAFVHEHHTAVFGYGRATEGPAMSVVHYVIDDDETILVSSSRVRAKTKAVRRNPKVSLCVLDEHWPPVYLQVYCDAEVDTDEDRTVDVMMRIGGIISGAPLDESVRPLVADAARREGRVALRLHPYATFETPPRTVEEHAHGDAGGAGSTTLPWRAGAAS